MEKLDPIKAAGVIGAKLGAELRKKIIIPQEKKGVSRGIKAPSQETFTDEDKKKKTKKIKPKLTVLSNEEKDKQIRRFFGKDTSGVVTEEPFLNTKEKIEDYVNSTQSDYEREAGIKSMSFQKRMKIKEEKERREEKKPKEAQKILEKDEVLENIMARMKMAAEVGDEEEIKKLDEEIKKHKEELKTGEELFEEAQALDSGQKRAEYLQRELETKKVEMQIAEKAYLEKRGQNEGFLRNIGTRLGIKSLGQADLEEGGLKEEFEKAKKEYDGGLSELKELQNLFNGRTKEEKPESELENIQRTEKEISSLPEKERKKTGLGLRNVGFYAEELKNKFFAGTINLAAKRLPKSEANIAERGSFARFLISLSENFKKDEQKARMAINKTNEGEAKKFANVGYLTGNILRYGRIATDFTKWTVASPLKYWMMSAMALSRSFEAIKEARMKGKKLIDKTRIHDVDEAAEEAWKIYSEAMSNKDSVSKEDLERAYTRNIPQDLLRRLNKNSPEVVAGGFARNIIRWDVRKLTEKINKKIDNIEKNDKLSEQAKEEQKEKIFVKYSDYIKSFDRIVSQAGTVDALAMGAQYLKTGSKAVVYGVTAETLAVLTQKVFENTPHILGEVEKIIHQSAEKGGGHSISFLDNTEISQEGHPLHGPFNESPGENLGAGEPSGEAVLEKPINLTVEKDGSLEGTLIDHLEKGGMDHDAAGRQADIFIRHYADEKGIPFEKLNHVLPDQEIELNPDGTVKSIPGFESAPADIPAEPKIEVVPDNIKEPEIEIVPDNVAEPAPENLPNPADSHFGRNVSYVMDDLDKHINENTSELSRPETHDAEELAAFREKIADFGYSRGFLENFRDSVFRGNMEEATKSFRSAISLDEKWDNIKGMNFREAAKNMNWRASDKLDTIFKCLKETLGNDARPGGGETLEKWTERVSKLAIEKTK